MSFAVIQRCILSKCTNSTGFNVYRKINSVFLLSRKTVQSNKKFVDVRLFGNSFIHTGNTRCKNNTVDVQENYSAFQIKRKPVRRKKSLSEDGEKVGTWNVQALTTAEEYNLEGLVAAIKEQNLYTPNTISATFTCTLPDVIHAVAKYEIEHEPREIFFFREGTIVMWNISELESGNLLQFIKKYEENRYAENIVQAESEIMSYSYADPGKQSHLKDGNIMLATTATNLDKYTFSNALAQSVKLGIWEASLNHYIDSIEFVTDDLKAGKILRMTQHEVLRKQGELFALRHFINLSSDLLDTPDFYWERDDLELLYQQICGYFSIAKRTRVMNEKLNHCVELVAIVSSHLSDRHHIRLEWMIIILIMVEVGFEILHYIDRYFS